MPYKKTRARAKSKHNDIIDGLTKRLNSLGGKAGRVGFRRGIKEALEPHIYEEIEYSLHGFVPDVWHVYKREDGALFIAFYEVENSHRLSVEKLRNYAAVWFAFDCEDPGITIKLYSIVNEVVHEIPLDAHYFSFMCQDAEEQGRERASAE